jgi:hypothetical protein
MGPLAPERIEMSTDKPKYVDLNPSEWPASVGAAIEAFHSAREKVGAEITKALQAVNLCASDHAAMVGFNYGKVGLAVNATTGAPVTKKALGAFAATFKPPAALAQAPAPAQPSGQPLKK